MEVGIEMKKIGHILNVRWSASSFRTIKAIWENYPGIHRHVGQTLEIGLKKKLKSSFLEELGLFYDVLSELGMLSCILQSRKTTLMRAQSEMCRTIRILESMKTEPGEEVFKKETDDDRGEEEVKRVSRRFGLSEFEILVNFRSRNASSDLIKTLNILPTTTSECERGISDMNLTITDLRTRLTIENVSDLMFISINGPPS